jgi:tRNA synthetases class I (R)
VPPLPPCAPQPPRVSHVGFGLVLGEDGKKFKTRSGDVVRLVELLDEAKSRCSESIRSRREEVRIKHSQPAVGLMVQVEATTGWRPACTHLLLPTTTTITPKSALLHASCMA